MKNSKLVGSLNSEDLFFAEAFCGDGCISHFLVKQLHNIFDNLPINKKWI